MKSEVDRREGGGGGDDNGREGSHPSPPGDDERDADHEQDGCHEEDDSESDPSDDWSSNERRDEGPGEDTGHQRREA